MTAQSNTDISLKIATTESHASAYIRPADKTISSGKSFQVRVQIDKNVAIDTKFYFESPSKVGMIFQGYKVFVNNGEATYTDVDGLTVTHSHNESEYAYDETFTLTPATNLALSSFDDVVAYVQDAQASEEFNVKITFL